MKFWGFLLLILITIYNLNANANGGSNKNPINYKPISLYLEIVGQGLGLSVNWDYRFDPHFAVRGGYSFLLFGYGVPISIYYLTDPASSHHLELGGGVTFGKFANFFSGSYISFIIPSASIGYRYQPRKGGLLFRIALTPLIIFEKYKNESRETGDFHYHYRPKILPWGGISLGVSF
ncbi:hypothetical protein D9V84_02345 [Bacteroidetes/Chlorobi group bacterium Naka2016]|jgi:hypothetical protein|nr:MAG: hypothetical protein D9V84_02345 [Bacteroidetes/Chlorobi group bacterium Naka2016]